MKNEEVKKRKKKKVKVEEKARFSGRKRRGKLNHKLNHCDDMIRESRLIQRAIARTKFPVKDKFKTTEGLPREWR